MPGPSPARSQLKGPGDEVDWAADKERTIERTGCSKICLKIIANLTTTRKYNCINYNLTTLLCLWPSSCFAKLQFRLAHTFARLYINQHETGSHFVFVRR